MPVTATPSPPSTSGVPATQEIDTPVVATSTAPTTTTAIPEAVVLPPVQAEIVPAAPFAQTNIVPALVAERGIRATYEAR
ncbi:hypothetical protein Sjap_002390 [Stephania japonica]|uniref:Uncharacterized protein n=1 Tax=Stephania japonica TaxID=461633 RepID=A0AAP0KMQ4_9MAGN